MLSEIQGIFKSVFRWVLVFLILALYFSAFNVQPVYVAFAHRTIVVPILTQKSFAADFFQMMRNDLVPSTVALIVTSPFDAFLIQMEVSFFLALVFMSPFILWGIVRFLSPALKARERRLIYRIIVPSTILFIAGCVFSYIFVLPATIRILYTYTYQIGATAFFTADSFIGLIFTMMAVTGIMFLLPVFMGLSSAIGIISYEFWKSKWRHAIFIFIVFSAIITPDGTGITMTILSVPLILLYIAGLAICRRYAHKPAPAY